MKTLACFIVAAGAALQSAHAEAATPIKVNMRIEINRVDGGPPQLTAPLFFDYSATFDAQPSGVYDQGTSTYTYYINGGTNVITSNVFSLLPSLAQQATPYQSVQGRSSDYADVFINSIAFSDQRYYDAGEYLGQTVTELFFDVRTPSRGGNGTGDHPLSGADVSDILEVGKTSSFFIFDRVYNPANTRTTWSGTATITGVTGAVPEPATWALMLTGIALTGCALRRQRANLATV